MLRSAASALRFGRTTSVASCYSSRPLQTAAAASPSPTPAGFPARSSSPPPLLARLVRVPESGVKMALELDKETEASAPGRRSDALFWEPLLVALRSSSPAKADLVLEWKLEKLLEEDVRGHEHFSNLITLCAKLENLPLAMRVFTTMESRGIRSNVNVFNALIRACISSDNVLHALSLFEIMSRCEDCKPNLATYNAFIAMHSKRGDSKRMLGWYSAGKSEGFSPDVTTYQALIAGFTRAGEFEDASHYFEEMAASGIMPNLDILDCVLEGLCRQKKLGDVKEFLSFLLGGGWDVNERMVENVVSLYTDLSSVEEMEELLRTLQRNSNTKDLLSRVHRGIIKLYACLDRLDAVEYAVGRMLKNGMQFTCPRDVEAVISCYFRHEAYERLDLFLERVRGSCRLLKSTYDLLVAGYRRVGLQDRLELVMKDMRNDGSV